MKLTLTFILYGVLSAFGNQSKVRIFRFVKGIVTKNFSLLINNTSKPQQRVGLSYTTATPPRLTCISFLIVYSQSSPHLMKLYDRCVLGSNKRPATMDRCPGSVGR